MKILITAFDAFGGEKVNPTELVLERLPDAIDGAELIKLLLPTSYDRAPTLLRDKINETHPDAVIMLGQAGGRGCITPERVAVNLMDAKAADNDGTVRNGVKICPDGEEEYYATLPIDAIVGSLTDAGLPAYVSDSAGRFVCNRVMYEALQLTHGTKTRAGFVHIPYVPEQIKDKPDGTPSLPLDEATRGIEIILHTLV